MIYCQNVINPFSYGPFRRHPILGELFDYIDPEILNDPEEELGGAQAILTAQATPFHLLIAPDIAVKALYTESIRIVFDVLIHGYSFAYDEIHTVGEVGDTFAGRFAQPHDGFAIDIEDTLGTITNDGVDQDEFAWSLRVEFDPAPAKPSQSPVGTPVWALYCIARISVTFAEVNPTYDPEAPASPENPRFTYYTDELTESSFLTDTPSEDLTFYGIPLCAATPTEATISLHITPETYLSS